MIWTTEQIETLKRLVHQGASSRQAGIATGLGKNACVGKARRLGLVWKATLLAEKGEKVPRPRIAKPPKPKDYIEVKKVRSQRNYAVVTKVKIPRVEMEPRIIEPELALEPCTLEECQERKNACRWPIGPTHERAKLFCGAPQAEGSAYCHSHHVRSRQAATGSLAAAEKILAREAA